VTATEALKQARAAGIQVRIDGDDLTLEASAPPPGEVLDLLARHKSDILVLLRLASNAALPALRSVPRGSCERCKYRTKFGNCGQPVRAGLSERFELIAHPAGGKDCTTFRGRSPSELERALAAVDAEQLNGGAVAPFEREDAAGKSTGASINTSAGCQHLLRRDTCGATQELLREVDRLLRGGLIDSDDAAAARASIAMHCRNPGYLREWRTLLRWCAQARPGPSGAN